jgi:hypothetical protein
MERGNSFLTSSGAFCRNGEVRNGAFGWPIGKAVDPDNQNYMLVKHLIVLRGCDNVVGFGRAAVV